MAEDAVHVEEEEGVVKVVLTIDGGGTVTHNWKFCKFTGSAPSHVTKRPRTLAFNPALGTEL